MRVNKQALIAGKYRLERVLGEGGMGIVMRATNVDLDTPVALKFLRHEARSHDQVVARFAQEGRALARLTSEHVARILDEGELDDGTPFIVMEYLEGEDLGAVLAHRGRLPLQEVVTYMLQVCEALAEAHAARIVHRDLKPANIFLTHNQDGRLIVKVLDFGIAKTLGAAESLTRTASGLGTVNYIAPEQMLDAKNCDERADIWSLGVTLYELTTGQLPFSGTLHEVFMAIREQRRCGISELLPSAPARLEMLVDHCLRNDPSLRPASVAHFAAELAALVDTPEHRASSARIRRVLEPRGSLHAPALPRDEPADLHSLSPSSIATSETPADPPATVDPPGHPVVSVA